MRGTGLLPILAVSCVASCGPAPRPTAPRDVTHPAPEPRQYSPPRDAPYSVGWTRLKERDSERRRPVWIDVWYPVIPATRETPRRYSLTMGSAATDAELAAIGPAMPVVVVSHGSTGSADQYSWATEGLAAHGFVVASVHHWGESRVYGRTDRLAPFRFSERSADVRFALDRLVASPRFAGKIASERVGGLGHSAGAFTLMTLTGARYSVEALGEYCQSTLAEQDLGCRMPQAMGVTPDELLGSEAACPSTRDSRLAVVFALDPALGPAFSPEQLARVPVALRISAAVPGDFVPSFAHAEHWARFVPGAELSPLTHGEGHFVHLDHCDLQIDVLGVPLCRDAAGVSRSETHARVLEDMLRFFQREIGSAP